MSVKIKEQQDSGSNGEAVVEQAQAGAEMGAAAAEGGDTQGEASAAASDAEATDGDPSPGEEGDGEKPPVVSYKPREKFKVRIFDPTLKDNDEKLQKEEIVPEWLKPLMKDADSEKQVLELLEKAHGIEAVKSERAHVRKERDELKGQVGKIMSQIGELREVYQKGDIDLWLEKLQIPEERMLQWALDKVNYSQLPSDQQHALKEAREAQRKAWTAEKANQSYEQQIQEQARSAKQALLQSSLSRPDVQAFADAFETQVGQPGAFLKEIQATGQLAWVQSNGQVDLTPEQAIEQVMQRWGKFVAPAQAATAPSAAAAGSQGGAGAKPNPAAKPSVIPNVTGRTSSPMKSKPRSIEDLKKIRDQATG